MDWARTAGFIVLAYIVFTTMKGNLRKWLQIIGLKPDGEAPQFDAPVTRSGIDFKIPSLGGEIRGPR